MSEHDLDANDEGESSNKHIHVSDDDVLSADYNGKGNDWNDSQQHDSDSQGDSDNEPKIDDSDDDSESSPNDIDQPEDLFSLSRSHNRST